MSPFVMVIFGATGDLTRKKLIPALFSLFKQKQLPEEFFIIGFARREFTSDEFVKMLEDDHKFSKEDDLWKKFAAHIYYQQGLFEQRRGYKQLIQVLKILDEQMGACITRLFYLATPPSYYPKILEHLHKTKLTEGCGQGSNKWTKIIVEKPFGKDLETAKYLDQKLSEIFDEKQIFRVDHYLAKETMQNIIAFRFANGIFEPIWNNNYIDNVQITWAEKQGILGRGRFFDGLGLLRDVAQNHLMQLLAAVAMEQPETFSKEGLRDVRADAIKAIRKIDPKEVSQFVVKGQYAGYREEHDVLKHSNTETFVAMKLFVDTERFKGVPFYIRAGKKMPKDQVSISIVFKQTCHILFKEYGCPEEGNVLTIHIQPDEGITLRVIAKKPGTKLSLGTVDMKFSYREEFGQNGANAYEKLIMDIFYGDQMLFNRSDELQSSWELITKILEGWKIKKTKFPNYDLGTWGPSDAINLIEKDGKKWIK